MFGNGGERCNVVGGDGSMLGKLAADGVNSVGRDAAASLAFVTESMYVTNLLNFLCHWFQGFSGVKRLYLMLLKNSTSIT